MTDGPSKDDRSAFQSTPFKLILLRPTEITEQDITLVTLSSEISEDTTGIRASVMSGTWSAKRTCVCVDLR